MAIIGAFTKRAESAAARLSLQTRLVAVRRDVRLLYRSTPLKSICTTTPPDLGDCVDVISIQRFARKIASFYRIRWHDPTTIYNVAWAKQPSDKGAHVSFSPLKIGHPVWIEIDPSIRRDPKLLTHAVAHELAHVALEERNCRFKDHDANEQLVDLFTAWSGFAPVMASVRQRHSGFGHISATDLSIVLELRRLIGPCYGTPPPESTTLIHVITREISDVRISRDPVRECVVCGQSNRIGSEAFSAGPNRIPCCGLCGWRFLADQ